MLLRVFLFFLFFSSGFGHPVIILLSHPRSLSTAFERIIRQRGDFHVLHEPFTYLHFLEHFPDDEDTTTFDPAFPDTYKKLRTYILELKKEKPVFIKDMAFASNVFLFEDLEFLLENEFQFVVLKRDPIKSLTSLYAIDPTADREFIGYEALYQTAQMLPLSWIFDADELESVPFETYQTFCNRCSIPFLSNALTFKRPPPPVWNGIWYDRVKTATKIEKSDKCYPIDEAGLPLFDSFAPEDRPLWINYYQEAKYFYENLRMQDSNLRPMD